MGDIAWTPAGPPHQNASASAFSLAFTACALDGLRRSVRQSPHADRGAAGRLRSPDLSHSFCYAARGSW